MLMALVVLKPEDAVIVAWIAEHACNLKASSSHVRSRMQPVPAQIGTQYANKCCYDLLLTGAQLGDLQREGLAVLLPLLRHWVCSTPGGQRCSALPKSVDDAEGARSAQPSSLAPRMCLLHGLREFICARRRTFACSHVNVRAVIRMPMCPRTCSHICLCGSVTDEWYMDLLSPSALQ